MRVRCTCQWVVLSLALFGMISCSRSAAQTIVRRPWYESTVDSNSLTLAFATNGSASATVLWGLGSTYSGIIDAGSGTVHEVTIPNLQPATIYHIALVAGRDTASFFSSTASDYHSSGKCEVYFNRAVDSTQGLHGAVGNADYAAVLRDHIAHVEHTIDVAIYSFSGPIADSVVVWLSSAIARGVTVRLIADSTSVRNSSQFAKLSPAGVHAITNSFGANATLASNIHHNKFIVFDGRSGDGSTTTLMTGSWNLTEQQTTTDFQNVLYIHDLALARAYEIEFNQEWGSTGDQPDARYARFSTNKQDITPRTFNVGGRTMHLFFCPDRGAAVALDTVLAEASKQVLFTLYVFTRKDLAQTLISQASMRQLEIHGIVGETDTYEQTPALRAAGIDALDYSGPPSVLLHDKYAIVDASTAVATVATGSFNWSLSADQSNNENLLFVNDPIIARLYVQDWLERYRENGGKATVSLPTGVLSRVAAQSRSLAVFPNPSSGTITLQWNEQSAGEFEVTIFDPLGRVVLDQTQHHRAGEVEHRIVLPASARAGVYNIRVLHDGIAETTQAVIER